MKNERLTRINELYRKSKAEGLTPDERKEQALLREQFLADFRRNLEGQLDQIDIEKEDGSIENLGEKFNHSKKNQG